MWRRPRTRRASWLSGALALGALALCVSGCRSPRVSANASHLLLSDQTLTAAPEAGADMSLSLRAVRLPEHLEGRRMVRLVDGDRVEPVQGHAWAENFAPSVRAVLEENMARLLNVPCLASPGREQLTLTFRRLSLTERGTVCVSVLCVSSRAERGARVFEFEQAVEDASRPARGYSQALSRLSQQIIAWLLQPTP